MIFASNRAAANKRSIGRHAHQQHAEPPFNQTVKKQPILSTMKTACVALALMGSASGFIAPMANVHTTSPSALKMSSSEPMSRSRAISTVFATGAATIAAAAVPTAAFADGARSLATQARARGTYGGRIEALKGAVEKGDTAAVLDSQNVFSLFNSGVYSTNKSKFAKADELAKAVVSAASKSDAAGMKTAYAAYMKYTEKKSGYNGAGDGQGFGSEFDYKNRTPLGTVYQR